MTAPSDPGGPEVDSEGVAPREVRLRWGADDEPTNYVRADLADGYKDALRELIAADDELRQVTLQYRIAVGAEQAGLQHGAAAIEPSILPIKEAVRRHERARVAARAVLGEPAEAKG